MPDPLVSIILRSFNEGWALRETLAALQAQEYRDWELIVIDSGSTDGSVELLRAAQPRHFIRIAPHEYNPARVMNHGMQLARSEFGIFLNADATPQGTGWLRPLVNALFDARVAAVFGRQIPRPDCRAVYAHDYERCFGRWSEATDEPAREDARPTETFAGNRESAKWGHFFSMASSGIRKDIWAKRGFDEQMQYSEDDEWTRWARAQGYQVRYVPESVATHSHNYTPAQAWKRSFGEARALAAVWPGDRTDFNFFRTLLLGWLNDARRDLIYCVPQRRLREWPHALRIRWQQRRGKLAGFHDGWEFYRNGTLTAGRTPLTNRSLRVRSETGAPRFTLDGSDELEHYLASTCERVQAGVQQIVHPDKLAALVLGGGYGRGEGGVLKTKTGERPYNDLEFYVFLRGNRFWNERKFGRALRELGEQLSPTAGLHVEFKVDSLARFRRAPITMFSYDLVAGHRVLAGSATPFLGCEHHLAAAKIPLSEATRLLMNRCSGLLFAREKLARESFTADDADFVGRNLAKAQLAFGDVLLTAFGQYHWSCLERRARLQQLSSPGIPPWLDEVRRHHVVGVASKLHPVRSTESREALAKWCEEITRFALKIWLWLEGRRLGQHFDSARDYALSTVNKYPDTNHWRNALLNVKIFGPGITLRRNRLRHPQEVILNTLALLLWKSEGLDSQLRTQAPDQLPRPAVATRSPVAAYQSIWRRLN